jgi:L-seryl-tRNA(Ser) seleniumtransferase
LEVNIIDTIGYMPTANKTLRKLPSVDRVLLQPDVQALLSRFPREVVVEGIRLVLEAKRKGLRSGKRAAGKVTGADVATALGAWMQPSLRKVINATGVVVHTNLGRAPLAPEAAAAIAEAGAAYTNLEMDLNTGRRGSRMEIIREILLERTGAEDALVVNNNAAAVYLALKALASGREVVVSRGELVEIGGSFRIPDVMAASGAHLVEVGTTNKTRIGDYEKAIGPDTALLLKVHRSNFELVGFTEETSVGQLSGIARKHRIPLMMDMGCGTLLDRLPAGMGFGPTVKGILSEGADLVCFSGDKLLGGPQSGVLLGRTGLVQCLAKDPMARALRVGKLTLAALWATLSLYRGGDQGARAVPVVGMLLAEPRELKRRAERLEKSIGKAAARVVPTVGQVGGGAMPLIGLEGFGVALKPKGKKAKDLVARLRAQDPPVLARLHQDQVILDVRAVLGDAQLDLLAQAVRKVIG